MNKASRIGLVILLLSTSYFSRGQNDLEKETITKNFQTAIEQLKLARAKEKKDSLFDTLLEQIDSHEAYIEDSLKAIVYHQLGHFHYNNYQDLAALKAYKTGLRLRQNALPTWHPDLAGSYYMTAVLQAFVGELEYSLANYVNAGKIYEGLGRDADKLDCNINQASLLVQLGEYEEALDYFNVSLKMLRESETPDRAKIAQIHEKLGILYNKQKKCELALTHLQEAIKYFENDEVKYRRQLAICYGNIGEVFINKEVFEEALNNYQTALFYLKQEYGEMHQDVALVYESEAVALKGLEELDRALDKIDQAYAINQQIFKDQKTTAYRRNFHNKASIFLAQKNYPEAIQNIQKALQQSIFNFNETDYWVNPDWSSAEFLGARIDVLQDVELKATIFYQWYQSSRELKYLQAANETYLQAIKLIELMSNEFSAKASKQFWLKSTFPIFEKAIEVTIQLAQQTPQVSQQPAMFYIMEQSKAILLMETLNGNKDNLLKNIPDSIRYQKRKLLSSISEVERKLIDLKQAQMVKDSALELVKANLAELNVKKFELLEIIKKNFPKYYELTRKKEIVPLQKVKQQLHEHHALLEFFYGESTIYAIALTNNQAIAIDLPKADIPTKIVAFRALLAQPNPQNMLPLKKLGAELYTALLQPLLSKISADITDLIIIRDGDLYSLPFELFVRNEVNVPSNFADISFLQKDYTINYALSATLFFEKVNTSTDPQVASGFVGFAPSFMGENSFLANRSCSIDNLGKLDFNEREVESIRQIVGGQSIVGNQASKTAFLEAINHVDMLHLATHACVDDQHPEQSRIYFTDDYLYLHELYNLSSRAKMVVLSACETGIGAYQQGEGMMSLSHGFAYAGVPSITTSLWPVNDQSTAELMTYFYQHLKMGKAKHEALRQTKLDYLANQESVEKLHPYYWAGFVHVGDVSPIESAPSFVVYYVLMAVFLLLLVGALYFRVIQKSDGQEYQLRRQN
ncbi:MAG: CHAT domain-containing protein [Bacteroidota bacterium]